MSFFCIKINLKELNPLELVYVTNSEFKEMEAQGVKLMHVDASAAKQLMSMTRDGINDMVTVDCSDGPTGFMDLANELIENGE